MVSVRKRIKPLYLIVKRSLLKFIVRSATGWTLPQYSNVIIVAPHPDDEILGLGGFILQQLKKGGKVSVLYLTDGEASLADIDDDAVRAMRIRLSNEVLGRLGISDDRIFRFHLADGSIPRKNTEGFDDAAAEIQQIFSSLMPDAVFVTHPQETWPYDHIAAFELADAAIHKTAFSCDFYGYWVWLWYSMPFKSCIRINWNAVTAVAISDELTNKKELIDIYLRLLAPNGKPWSGVLPKAMTDAFGYPYEVVEKIK
ncbi:MAG: hypothetical protein HGA57_05935 [Chlorobium limicola]|uniref:PIG-L deacetylase family protein n=1 Tax=Chlorobium limicola TaxID=1092 RepID=UPI0023F42C2D|nr:PIG-L family deacetylase [Chlorobium limicola]NTV20909.1 hypothetical protein [Chlorobium limicola]